MFQIRQALFVIQAGEIMFVILVYDVAAKRVGKVMKTTKKYLIPVQNSAFVGVITESKLSN